MCARALLLLACTAQALLLAGAIEDVLSYKSLVLGSLSSGERKSGRVRASCLCSVCACSAWRAWTTTRAARQSCYANTVNLAQVSRSSCHNYFINVTDFGYNLVVDLDTRMSSSQLFLLVKASPILRHSLEDEHNYASYYQFKKQGDHHGVVVTSEHLSPGRWYIGVCNSHEEMALFDDKRATSQHNPPLPGDAAYSVVATLNRTKEKSEEKPQRERTVAKTTAGAISEARPQDGLNAHRGFESVEDSKVEGKSCAAGDVCKKDQQQDQEAALELAAMTERKLAAAAAAHRKRAEEEERRLVGERALYGGVEDETRRSEALFWAVRAEALEKEVERMREEMAIVKDELTTVLSHTKPAETSGAPLPPLLQDQMEIDAEGDTNKAVEPSDMLPRHPAAGRRKRNLSAIPAFMLALVPETLLPGGAMCDEMGVCIFGVSIGLLLSAAFICVAIVVVRGRELSRDEKHNTCAKPVKKQPPSSSSHQHKAALSASPGTADQRKASKGVCAASKLDAQKLEAGSTPGLKERANDVQQSSEILSSHHVELLEGRCGLMQGELSLKHRQHEGDGGQRGAEEWLPDSEAQERERAREQELKVQELMQALEDANSRVSTLESDTRRWKENAEAKEAHIARISREKAAAEKAAEVLESLLSHGPSLTTPPPTFAGSGAVAAVQADPGSGKRRPPAVHAELGITPTHSAFNTPLRTVSSSFVATNAAAGQQSASLPPTPMQGSTGLAPIGTPSPHHLQKKRVAKHTPASTPSPAVSRISFGPSGDSSFERSGSTVADEEGFSGSVATPMDGSAFAAFMGINSALECSLSLEALEGESSCGSAECCAEQLCHACMARHGNAEQGGALECVNSEEGSNHPTRARGRRGGRRQKRVGADPALPAVEMGAGASPLSQTGTDGEKESGDLATSMALAALQDE